MYRTLPGNKYMCSIHILDAYLSDKQGCPNSEVLDRFLFLNEFLFSSCLKEKTGVTYINIEQWFTDIVGNTNKKT